jgi:hypothetical protein
MEAEMKFHACIHGPMSFDWHGSISPGSGLAFRGSKCVLAQGVLSLYTWRPRRLCFKRGSAQPGCILGVCGSGVPPYDFSNLYGVFNSRFSVSSLRETARTKDL